jgi:hypothetical protein
MSSEIQLSEYEKLIQQTANALLEAQETNQLEEVNMEGLKNDVSYLNERTDGEEKEDGSPSAIMTLEDTILKNLKYLMKNMIQSISMAIRVSQG